jgi:hypothetical protein
MSDVDWVLAKLAWMREERIWPNGLRYLWTDAFGVVLFVSLYRATGDRRWIDEAEALVREVERVLGRKRGIRIGEAEDRDGQYFHYLAMWIFALARLGAIDERYRTRGIELVREIHRPFVIPRRGVIWKMKEDLSAPYPGTGLGAIDAFKGYVSYSVLAPDELAAEIAEMKAFVDEQYRGLNLDQDLSIGMMLWMSHVFPNEEWARVQRARCLRTLDMMWLERPGYFARHPGMPRVRYAFTNYGVSIGLQAVGEKLDRVDKLNAYFENYRANDEYDRDAITHVMACSSRLPGDLLRERRDNVQTGS